MKNQFISAIGIKADSGIAAKALIRRFHHVTVTLLAEIPVAQMENDRFGSLEWAVLEVPRSSGRILLIKAERCR